MSAVSQLWGMVKPKKMVVKDGRKRKFHPGYCIGAIVLFACSIISGIALFNLFSWN